MYCKYCGAENPDDALRCGACGKALQPRAPGAPTPTVPNYLVQAILVTLCCCVPFGIVAIVYASQVNAKLAAGDYAGAVEASQKAKTWCWVALGAGALIGLLYLFAALGGLISNNF